MKNKLQDKLYEHSTYVDTDEIWNGMQKKRKRRIIPFLLFGLGVLTLSFYLALSLTKRNNYFSKNEDNVAYKSKTKQVLDLIKSSTIDNKQIEANQKATYRQINNRSKVNLDDNLASENIKSASTVSQKNLYDRKINSHELNHLNSKYFTTSEKSAIETKEITPSNEIKSIAKRIQDAPEFKEDIINYTNQDIKTIATLNLNLLKYNGKLDIEIEKVNILPTRIKNSFSIHIGTLITQNKIDTYTKALPGIDVSLSYHKLILPKIKIGLGINYVEHREHLKIVRGYSQTNQIDAVTSEIYYQDGTIETTNSLVSVTDQYERSLSKVNRKSRVDLILTAEYQLFRIGRFTAATNAQANFKLVANNRGLELREDQDDLYNIYTDVINIINKDNKLSLRLGIGLGYALSDQMTLNLAVQKYQSLQPFYTDRDVKYKGYNSGLTLDYRW